MIYIMTEAENELAKIIWENEPLPSGELVRLAQEFGVTTDYLLMGETPACDPSAAPELPSISVRTEALVRLLSRTMK